MLRDHFTPYVAVGSGAVGLEPDEPALEAALEDALRRAREAHPRIALADEIFLPYLASKLTENVPAGEALQQLDIAALYLACACARGDVAALSEIERAYLPKLDGALARAGATGDRLDEVKQQLRERLFIATSAGAPRIVAYAGRGDLGRWLRSVAVRIAIDIARRPHEGGDDKLDDLALGADDPELAHLKERYRVEARAAMQTAFAGLDSEARGDLRLYYLEGMRLVDLAALRRVAVSTMSRRLQAARDAVVKETRVALRAQLAIDRQDLDSILALVGSRLDLSRKWLETKR